MNLSQNAGLTGLNAIAALYNGGVLQFYNGIMPAYPDISPAGTGHSYTLLAAFTFANPAFPTPLFDLAGYYKAQASFVANSVTPSANGVAFFARSYVSGSGGVNAAGIEDRTVGQPWRPSMSVAVGQFVMAGGNTYSCTAAGTTAASGAGPSGSGMNIADGTATWQLWNVGAPDILLASATLSTSTPLTLPYFWLAMPCA